MMQRGRFCHEDTKARRFDMTGVSVMPRTQRVLLVIALLGLVGPLLACGVGGLSANRPPRWACPSPTPLPWGRSGPVKDRVALPTDVPSGPQEYENVFYEEWEREYAPLGGPPFPSPTPYSVVGLNYVLGQRVEISPLHVLVTARSGAVVTLPGVAPNTQQLYYVDITWYNHTAESIPIAYAERVRVRAVTAPSGAIVTDSNWGLNHASLTVSGMSAPPDAIPPGESAVSVPIIAPVGEVKTVEITFTGQPGGAPVAGTPTVTPAPNDNLQGSAANELTVTWTNTRLDIGPECGDAGAMTNWDDGSAWGNAAALAISAPPGAGRLIQIALNQVGKAYIWGAKGPEQFDCSGLTQWSYAQISIRIPTGTAGQWPQMRPVNPGELQPGDLIFFAVATPGKIDHVGMLAGDLNGDGRWDMVHAATPALGVRVEYSVLDSPFWGPKIAGFRTAR
jgi:cell wall-associated NlpC family hydrolase